MAFVFEKSNEELAGKWFCCLLWEFHWRLLSERNCFHNIFQKNCFFLWHPSLPQISVKKKKASCFLFLIKYGHITSIDTKHSWIVIIINSYFKNYEQQWFLYTSNYILQWPVVFSQTNSFGCQCCSLNISGWLLPMHEVGK